jgi:hypothetical protein
VGRRRRLWGGGDRKEDEVTKIKCFRCQGKGNHQKDCYNTPIYYKCKEERHMAVKCDDFHSKDEELKMYGFTIPDQGFYSIRIPRGGGSSKANIIIHVIHGEATEKKLEDELNNLINMHWDW